MLSSGVVSNWWLVAVYLMEGRKVYDAVRGLLEVEALVDLRARRPRRSCRPRRRRTWRVHSMSHITEYCEIGWSNFESSVLDARR